MVAAIIPKKLDSPEDLPKKFLVIVPTSQYLKLQHEAAERGTDICTLAGSVLCNWVVSGCPDKGYIDSQV